MNHLLCLQGYGGYCGYHGYSAKKYFTWGQIIHLLECDPLGQQGMLVIEVIKVMMVIIVIAFCDKQKLLNKKFFL